MLRLSVQAKRLVKKLIDAERPASLPARPVQLQSHGQHGPHELHVPHEPLCQCWVHLTAVDQLPQVLAFVLPLHPLHPHHLTRLACVALCGTALTGDVHLHQQGIRFLHSQNVLLDIFPFRVPLEVDIALFSLAPSRCDFSRLGFHLPDHFCQFRPSGLPAGNPSVSVRLDELFKDNVGTLAIRDLEHSTVKTLLGLDHIRLPSDKDIGRINRTVIPD